MRLRPAQVAAGWRLESFGALGSTNDECAARARAGDPGRLWVVASEQTAGRGRLGRQWASPPGNLYASLLLVDPAPPARAPELGFVAGVALIDALREVTGAGRRIELKWPNDALLDGGKLSGLLLEAATLAGGALACVAGFGVNCASSPRDLPYPARALTEFGATREDVFAALAAAFEGWLETWARGENFARVRLAWLDRAAGVGGEVEVAQGGRRLRGRFLDIDARARLRLATDSGEITIEAGDVFLPARGQD